MNSNKVVMIEYTKSCEEPNKTYLTFPDVRIVFEDGNYLGWYNHL